ncbi:integral peroxisomal membrane peroxin-domain-containing protein [Syncephalis pseudoplumigaleata]|uniref:Integral peroxisomal membrane peroxin-domain-containing protein n=1 Tax=Syncephalis pseudoplumigaleata TaxID=1712513 RepID=A0A4P9YYS6_9FUNG|nr:integral peroxisomal membrane peroxin-domain-containing protein [Syncephalis pseudoplumigaleata]|eukprot:RKP25214.1 integral peroxisomal membrane peroxin-domain-containing protein [Syncephalis pseudoplumigaleata]
MATAVSVMPEAPPSTTSTSTTSSSSISSVNTRLPVTLASTPFALTRLLLELAPAFRAVDWLLDILDWRQPSRSLLVLALWWIVCALSEWIYIYLLHWLVAGSFLWWYWQRRQVKPTAPHTAVDAHGTPIVSASPVRDDAEDLRAVSRTLDALNARLGRLRLRMKRMAARADLAAGDLLRWWLYSYPPWCLFNYQCGPRWSVAVLGGLLIGWRSPWVQFMYRFITSWVPRLLSRCQRRLAEREQHPLYVPFIQAVSLVAQASGIELRRGTPSRQHRQHRQRRRRSSSSTSSASTSSSTSSSARTDKAQTSPTADAMLPIPEEPRDEPQDTTCPDAQAKLHGRALSATASEQSLDEQTASSVSSSSASSDVDDPLFNSLSLDAQEHDRLPASGDEDEQPVSRGLRALLSHREGVDVDVDDDDEEDEAMLLSMHAGLTHRIILLEHQRWWVGLGWLTRFLPFDPYPWTDEDGHEAPSCDQFALPAPTTIDLLPKRQLGLSTGQIGQVDTAIATASEHGSNGNDDSGHRATQQTLGWKWIDAQWQIDQDTTPHLIDADGWSYADNLWSGWRSAPWMRAYTRRRRWWRRAMLVALEQP